MQDAQHRLYSFGAASGTCLELAQEAVYAQWAPSRDILVAQCAGKCLLWPDAEVPESVHLQDCEGQLVGLAEAQVCFAPSPPNRGPSLEHMETWHAQLNACMSLHEQ